MTGRMPWNFPVRRAGYHTWRPHGSHEAAGAAGKGHACCRCLFQGDAFSHCVGSNIRQGARADNAPMQLRSVNLERTEDGKVCDRGIWIPNCSCMHQMRCDEIEHTRATHDLRLGDHLSCMRLTATAGGLAIVVSSPGERVFDHWRSWSWSFQFLSPGRGPGRCAVCAMMIWTEHCDAQDLRGFRMRRAWRGWCPYQAFRASYCVARSKHV